MERKEKLEKLITEYATAYYTGESLVSDETFDSLVDELRSIAPESEILSKPGWGYEPLQGRKKVNHLFNLYVGSLPKYKTCEKISRHLVRPSTRISAKLDGLSVVSYYDHGKRYLSVTRGNGYKGLDVTDKIDEISPQTKEINSGFTGAIRGEVVMDKLTWDSVYAEKFKDNLSANPRNLTAGFMNRDELSEDLKNLRYVCYKIVASSNFKCLNTDEMDNFFEFHKFDYVPYRYEVNIDDDSLKELYDEFCEIYPCDGLVFTEYELDGTYDYSTEIAFKFPAESVEVTVTDVTYDATRTGRMAPRVWFNPVKLSGALVRKCTGFNAKFIEENGIGPGAIVKVCRSNEVIPHIMETIKSVEPHLPTDCPKCGTELVWVGDDLVCESENESQLAYRFITTVAPLEGAGFSLYTQIVEGLGLDSLDSLVNFLQNLKKSKNTDNSIKFLETFGNISGQVTWSKVREILNQLISDIDPVKFLVACNIKGISWTTAKSILDEYPDLIKDSEAGFNLEKLYSINGIGYRTVKTLEEFRTRIYRLSSNISFAEYFKEEPKDVVKVAITGKLSCKRSDFENLISKYGFVNTGIGKDVKYLITDDPNSGSSKNAKADKLGIEKITEEDFRRKFIK